jgi:RNA polymerase sigma-70 factor, ECF subfamily
LERVQLLFVRHQGALRAFIRGLQPSLADADDVLQETFLTISRKAETFTEGSNFLAWACRIARFKILEHHRNRARTTALSEAALEALAEASPFLEAEEAARREAALAQCLRQLSERMRALLLHRYHGRESGEVIAQRLAMTPLAVRVALSKARTALRDCLTLHLNSPAA